MKHQVIDQKIANGEQKKWWLGQISTKNIDCVLGDIQAITIEAGGRGVPDKIYPIIFFGLSCGFIFLVWKVMS